MAPSSSHCKVSLEKGLPALMPRTDRESAAWHPCKRVLDAGGSAGWFSQHLRMSWLGLLHPPRHACRPTSISSSQESAFLLVHPLHPHGHRRQPSLGVERTLPKVASHCTCRQHRPELSLNPEPCTGVLPHRGLVALLLLLRQTLELPWVTHNPCHRQVLETIPSLDGLVATALLGSIYSRV